MTSISIIITHQSQYCAPITCWISAAKKQGAHCIYVHYDEKYPGQYAYRVISHDEQEKIIFGCRDYQHSRLDVKSCIERVLAENPQCTLGDLFCEANLGSSGKAVIADDALFFINNFEPTTLSIFSETPECVTFWQRYLAEKPLRSAILNVFVGSKTEVNKLRKEALALVPPISPLAFSAIAEFHRDVSIIVPEVRVSELSFFDQSEINVITGGVSAPETEPSLNNATITLGRKA